MRTSRPTVYAPMIEMPSSFEPSTVSKYSPNSSSEQFGTIVGYENHSGQTFLREHVQPLGHVEADGCGNNGVGAAEQVLDDLALAVVLPAAAQDDVGVVRPWVVLVDGVDARLIAVEREPALHGEHVARIAVDVYDGVAARGVNTDLEQAVRAFVGMDPGTRKHIYCTYTAMLAVRSILGTRSRRRRSAGRASRSRRGAWRAGARRARESPAGCVR